MTLVLELKLFKSVIHSSIELYQPCFVLLAIRLNIRIIVDAPDDGRGRLFPIMTGVLKLVKNVKNDLLNMYDDLHDTGKRHK